MNTQDPRKPKQKGSILIIAMIFGVLLLTSAGVLLNFGVSEKAINQRHFLRLEAQAAAEAAVEYGFADLQKRWMNQTNFASNELQSKPLNLPSSVKSFFENSNVSVGTMNVTGGAVSNGRWVYINPKDPANLLDPQKQKRVYTRDVEVYGMASVDSPIGERNREPINAYCAQLLEVRDAPLFGHAIFYNMDLEFHPGPRMDIHGPVHCNSNIYVQAGGGGLYFHSNLMAAGDVWHSYKPTGVKSSKHLGPVKIKNEKGSWKEMYKGSGDKKATSSYYDSYMGDDWKKESEDRWDGRVASYDHEVPVMNALNIKDYVPDDLSTKANELENHAYALIEPQLAIGDPDFKGTDVQKEQFSYKAGLLLRITEDVTAPTGYDFNFYSYKRKVASLPNSDRLLSGVGKPVENVLDKSNLPANLVSISAYKETSGKPTSGFYDARQKQKMDVIDIDVALLRSAVDISDPAFDSTVWNDTYKLTPGSNFDWNGIMYVEVPTVTSSGGRIDKVKKAKAGVAVRLKNGSEIPSPPGAPDKGFTFATNAPLYVIGNYNADGKSSTGSATKTDDSDEKPAALIADAITILSNAWETSGYDKKSKEKASKRKAKFTEVSAAMLTGISQTTDKSNYSGGVHNFPRFLEKWSGIEFRYRGSMVSMFESEANWRPMRPDFGNWYSPPKRNWGFSVLFEDGEFPPGTPTVRDFRRKHFRFIDNTEYASLTKN